MKKLSILALTAAFLTLGLLSCNKDEKGTNEPVKTNKTVVLSIKAALTRAIDDPAKDKKTTISTGQIIFTDGSGIITQLYTISSAATDVLTGGTNVNDAGLVSASGVRFEGIKGTKVHVLANKAVTVSLGDNISIVKSASLGVTDLSNGTFANAILFGENVLTFVSGNDYTATVSVAPIVSRIEIGEIKETKGDYTFDFDGIYINNFYENMTVGGVVSNIKNHQSVEADYVSSYAGLTGPSTALNDTYTTVLGVSSYAPVPAGKFFTYNIFPAKSLVANDDLIPHIIIRMKNLKKSGVLVYPVGTDFYITVRTYSGKTITNFEAGKAYKITSLSFDASKNGGTLPEVELINADVTVVVEDWGGVDITADVN